MSTSGDDGPIYGLLTATDVEAYSQRPHDGQRDIQQQLHRLHERVASNARMKGDRAGAYVQGRGDGDLVRWPASTNIEVFLVDYLRELHGELARQNDSVPAGHQLRLRMSVVWGMSEVADQGLAGVGPIAATRLVDSEQARQALRIASSSALVVVLDEFVYQTAIAPGRRGLRPDTFIPVLIENPGKGFKCSARIWVPGCDVPVLAKLTTFADSARACAERLVSAMSAADWEKIRNRVAALVGYEQQLDADRARFAVLPPDERGAERFRQVPEWHTRLSDKLDNNAELGEQLRAVLAAETPLPPNPTDRAAQLSASAESGSTAIASGRDTVNAGRDIKVNSTGHTAITAATSAALATGATVAGANTITSGAGGAAAGAGAVTPAGGTFMGTGTTKFASIIGGSVLAATTMAAVGYGVYQHDNCGSIFGDRPAIEVLNTAASRVKDASFKFDFRMGNALRMEGEVDNRQAIGQFRSTMGSDTIEIILYDLTMYTRVNGGAWSRESGDIKEDPRISQGNPIKTAEYLGAAQDATRSRCDVHGMLDTRVLVPGTSDPPIPFDASVNPDDDLTRLKLTLPTRLGGHDVPPDMRDIEWQIYDHGTQVSVTPPQVA